jgi:hypothetical protein
MTQIAEGQRWGSFLGTAFFFIYTSTHSHMFTVVLF